MASEYGMRVDTLAKATAKVVSLVDHKIMFFAIHPARQTLRWRAQQTPIVAYSKKEAAFGHVDTSRDRNL